MEKHQLHSSFRPTLLVAVSEDSVAPARMLHHHLALRSNAAAAAAAAGGGGCGGGGGSGGGGGGGQAHAGASSLTVLTHKLEQYDDAANPYNPIVGSWAATS